VKLRFQTDPAGTYYAWKVWGLGDCKGLGIQIKAKMHRTLLFARTCHGFWSFTAFCGVYFEATAIGKNSKSVTDFLEKKCPTFRPI